MRATAAVVAWMRRALRGARVAAIRPRQISVASYLAARASGDGETEDAFLWEIRLWSGVFKATRRHRFDDTFGLLLPHLPPPPAALRVLDVACSSGISTVELHRALLARGHAVDTTGTDLVTRVHHVAFDDRTAVLADADGHLLAAEIDGMVIDRLPSRAVRLHHPLRVRRARAVLRQYAGLPCDAAGRPTIGRVTEVPLITAEVDRLAGIRVIDEDLLQPTAAGPFDVIRAANILNRNYFPEPLLERMVATLVPRLAPGGLLFVTRTNAARQNNGTLWRRIPGGLQRLGQLGEGSEIAAVVERAAPPV